MTFSGAGRCWCLVVFAAAVCAVLSGIPAFGPAYGVRAQCSPGYYGNATDGGACVQCTGYSLGGVQRGAPVPADEVVTADSSMTPSSVALSASGTVLALGFSSAAVGREQSVGVLRVYSWDGVVWVQRGGDIEGASARSFFGNSVALSEDGMTVSGSAISIPSILSNAGVVYVFVWDGSSWSPRGEPILGDQREGYLGHAMELSATGSVLVSAELFDDSLSRTYVHVWDARTRAWVIRSTPIRGPPLPQVYGGVSVAMSSDGDVIALGTRGSRSGLGSFSPAGLGSIAVYEWVPENSQYRAVGNAVSGALGEGLGGYGSVALSGDGLVLAAGVTGRGANGRESGGVRVFARNGQEWVRMGSVIEGAGAGDLAGSSVGLSRDGRVLLASSRGSDSGRGSLVLYVWSSGDWEQRGGLGGVFAWGSVGSSFGTGAALSRDGTVIAGIGGTSTGVGSRVFDLTAEVGIVDDAVCQTALNDNSAVFVANAGQCSGEGSADVCLVCTGGEYPIGPERACGVCMRGAYPIGPARACGLCPGGEYRHATSYTCDPCPANSAECRAVFRSGAWALDSSVTCGGLVSGCVVSPSVVVTRDSPQCSPGYYGDARDGGTCVRCTGHSVGSVQRGAPVPADEVATADSSLTPSSVALSASGTVLALGFSSAAVGRAQSVGVLRVYSWSGVAWVQRGEDIEGASARSFFGNSVALSENGMTVSGSAISIPSIPSNAGVVYVFVWDGSSWSPRGEPILGDQREGYLGHAMELSATGSVLVSAELFNDSLSRTYVHVWDTATRAWVIRSTPIRGPPLPQVYGGVSVAMSSDGDVIALGTRGSRSGLGSFSPAGLGSIAVYEWVPENSQYRAVGNAVSGALGEGLGGYGSVALSGDGLVLAAGVTGRGANGRESGGVRVFARNGQEWVRMGSVIEGASAGDLAGSSVGLSRDGRVLLASSAGSDSGRGSLVLYVWSSGDWEQRGGVITGALVDTEFGRGGFGTGAALSRGGTVVAGIGGAFTGMGSRVFNLTADAGIMDDAVCQTALNDDGAFVSSLDVCSGEGSVDVCGVCPPGEYRNATSYACDPCPADSAECQAVFGSGAWALDSSVTCGGLVSGCVVPPSVVVTRDSPQCSPGYYGDASETGACLLCTGHSVGTALRGRPVPDDIVATADAFLSPTSVAVSGSGAVLAVGFSGAPIRGKDLVGVVRVYLWSGVAWEQRGDDINGVSAGGGFGTVVALSEDGNIVSGSAPVTRAVSEVAAVVAVFIWDGVSWSARGSPIVGGQGVGYDYGYFFGMRHEVECIGYRVGGFGILRVRIAIVMCRVVVYVWDAGTSDWVPQGCPAQVDRSVAPVVWRSCLAMSG